MAENTDMTSLEELDLSPEIMKALSKMHITRPTTVQRLAIPLLMKDECLIAKAPTGTGKTFAFAIPILEYLDLRSKNIQALILAPTRELALQIATEIKDLGRYIDGLKVCSIIGGQSIKLQLERIAKRPQIVVATPGRLMDLMERRQIDVSQIYTLVLDEADEMLKMGFAKQVNYIMKNTPKDKQIALFSATMPREILNITWTFMQGAKEIDVMPKQEDRPKIDEIYVEISEKDKVSKVLELMEENGFERVIVFCNTKRQTRILYDRLKVQNVRCEMFSGDMGQGARNKIMDAFRKGRIRILIATDVVARGIDVDDIDAVINFDIPTDNEFYLHRIGRTARAGKCGKAFAFVTYTDRERMREIIRYTGSTIKMPD